MSGRTEIDAERLRDLLDRSVRCYSPSYDEARVVDLYAEVLGALGLPVQRAPVESGGHPRRDNLKVTLGPGPPALMLVGHVDTVALQPGEQLSPRWEGDVLHGLGAADMKGGCAAMIEALAAVRRGGHALSRAVTLALVVGEEDEGDGAKALFRDHDAPLVVFGEPTGLTACTAHYGYLEVMLEVAGRRAHAAVPEHGLNAIDGMLDWLAQVREALRTDPALDHVVCSVRSIEGGSALFAVPDACRAILDIHLPPERTSEHVEAFLRREGERRTKDGFRARTERLMFAPGERANPNARALEPLREALRAVGRPAETAPFPSHSDANLLYGREAIAVVLGPGTLDVAHTRRERIAFDEVVAAAELYAALIVAACS